MQRSVAEARFTVLNSGRRRENHERLEAFLHRCYVLPMSERTAALQADVRMARRRKGRPIPVNDMWIVAVCLARRAARHT